MAISLNKKNASLAVAHADEAPNYLMGKIESIISAIRRPVKTGELIFFSSQLSLMLEVGTSLTNALHAVADQTKNPAFKTVIEELVQNVEEGRQLSDALKRHPKVFDTTYASMIQAGEAGGFLKKALDGIVEMQEKRQNLVSQLRSAMTYPAILGVMSTGVVIFVLVGILPKFATLFEGKESLLPVTTLFLMAASRSMTAYWWVYLISGIVLVAGVKFWVGTKQGKRLVDRATISLPVISGLANKIYTAQLLRTMGHLMESQVPLIQALEVSRDTFSNQFYTAFIAQLKAHVEQGGRFSQPFADAPFILDSVKQMVATGEEVGSLPKVMLRLAEFYDGEIDRELQTISAMIEPAALVIMGTMVGLIVSAVILPIFRISSLVR